MTLGVLYNPWTGQSTRDWIMGQISGSDEVAFEEFEAELDAQADAVEAATVGNGSEPE